MRFFYGNEFKRYKKVIGLGRVLIIISGFILGFMFGGIYSGDFRGVIVIVFVISWGCKGYIIIDAWVE